MDAVSVSRFASPALMDTDVPSEVDPCTICYTDFHGRDVEPVIVRARCGHRFDLDCITAWFTSSSANSRACALCRGKGVPLVREAGARIYENSPFCEAQPLHACRTGDSVILQQLLSRDTSIARQLFRSAVTGNNVGLLFIAAQNNNLDCLQALIAAGADLNACTDKGCTPLFIAAEKNNPDCLQALIAAGADLDAARTVDGATSLFIAAGNNHLDCLQALIAAGADLNAARIKDGASPVFIAAARNNLDCLQALIAAGVDLNAARIKDGATPVFIAAKLNHLGCLQALIAAGADLNAACTDDDATRCLLLPGQGRGERFCIIQ